MDEIKHERFVRVVEKRMVKDVYEPIVKAIDRKYDVIVEFK